MKAVAEASKVNGSGLAARNGTVKEAARCNRKPTQKKGTDGKSAKPCGKPAGTADAHAVPQTATRCTGTRAPGRRRGISKK